MAYKDETGIIIHSTNEAGLIVYGEFTTSLPTTTNKFAPGCLLIGNDGKTYQNAGTSASPSFQDINSISTTEIADGSVTPVKYIILQDITATTDGTGTGVISATTTYADVTSSSDTKIVTLPAPVHGKTLIIDVGANGFKLQSSSPATIAINGGSGASAVSTIAANSTLYMICTSTTSWKGFFLDADSDVAKVPAAA